MFRVVVFFFDCLSVISISYCRSASVMMCICSFCLSWKWYIILPVGELFVAFFLFIVVVLFVSQVVNVVSCVYDKVTWLGFEVVEPG